MLKNKLSQEHLYLQVAGGLEKMIHDEVLKIGDKLPSVRLLSEEYGISMGTAFQAYYHLEGKGLIEARPKSGYYVRFSQKRFPAMPTIRHPEAAAGDVNVQDMIKAVFMNISANDVLNFSVATPPLELLPAAKLNKSIVHALRNSSTSCMMYEDIQGNKELRKQVAKLSFNWGGKIAADDIIITAGCMEAISMCLRTVTQPGDTVAIESPTFFGIFHVIQSLNLKVVEIPTDPVTGIDLIYLETAIKKFNIRACVFVPNFNNPLGCCMPDENKKALVELITKHSILLIEDDIYGELYFGRQRPKTCKTFDKEGWVMHCGSFSKSLAPGYRLGWTMPGRFTAAVLQTKMMNTITGTTITQSALAHFLSIGRYEYHLRNLRKALHTQCLKYIQGIMQYFPADTKISRPQGGFVLWLELNSRINVFELFKEAMKHQISIAPGQIFSSQGQYHNFVRISYGKPWNEKVEKAMKTLGNLVHKM